MKRHTIEILNDLKQDRTLLIMLATEIGERALREDPESNTTWETIGLETVDELLSLPMGRHG